MPSFLKSVFFSFYDFNLIAMCVCDVIIIDKLLIVKLSFFMVLLVTIYFFFFFVIFLCKAEYLFFDLFPT